jgi:hypothetical protein
MTPEQAKEILKRIKDRADIDCWDDGYFMPGLWTWGNEGELIPLIMEMCREMRD